MKAKDRDLYRDSELAAWLHAERGGSNSLTSPALDEEECIRAEIAMAALLAGTINEIERAELRGHLMQCSMCLHVAVELLGDEQRDALAPRQSAAESGTKCDRHHGDKSSAGAEITLH